MIILKIGLNNYIISVIFLMNSLFCTAQDNIYDAIFLVRKASNQNMFNHIPCVRRNIR
jgi:hypothetical protein